MTQTQRGEFAVPVDVPDFENGAQRTEVGGRERPVNTSSGVRPGDGAPTRARVPLVEAMGAALKDRLGRYTDAISGFSNADGGVIVWGVRATEGTRKQPGVATDPEEIERLDLFVRDLQRQTSQVTAPLVAGVQHHAVESEPGANRGFAVSYVPKGEGAPVQRRDDCRYYIRVGDSFMPMSHSMVASGFARRPQPCPAFSCEILRGGTRGGPGHHERLLMVVFGIRNTGRVLARDLALRLEFPDARPRLLEFSYGPLGLARQPTVGVVGAPEVFLYRGANGEAVHPGTVLQVDRAEYLASFAAMELPGFAVNYWIYCDGAQAEGQHLVGGVDLLAARGTPP